MRVCCPLTHLSSLHLFIYRARVLSRSLLAVSKEIDRCLFISTYLTIYSALMAGNYAVQLAVLH